MKVRKRKLEINRRIRLRIAREKIRASFKRLFALHSGEGALDALRKWHKARDRMKYIIKVK
jgi:hypothetical protein